MNRSRFAFAFLSVVVIIMVLSTTLPACSPAPAVATPIATAVGGYTAPTVDEKLEKLTAENASLKEAILKLEGRVKAVEEAGQGNVAFNKGQDNLIANLTSAQTKTQGRLTAVEDKANQAFQKAETAEKTFSSGQIESLFASINAKLETNNLFAYGAINKVAFVSVPIEGLVYENAENNGENYFIKIAPDETIRGNYKGTSWFLRGIRPGDRITILPLTGDGGTKLIASVIHVFRPMGTPETEEIVLLYL